MRGYNGHGMSALTLEPKRWYPWDFSVFEGARQLVDFQLSSWRTTGVLSVEGVNYRVSREGMLGDFVMQQAGSVLVRATKPSAFRRAFEIRVQRQEVYATREGAVHSRLRALVWLIRDRLNRSRERSDPPRHGLAPRRLAVTRQVVRDLADDRALEAGRELIQAPGAGLLVEQK